MEASCEGEDRFWEEYGRKKMNKKEKGIGPSGLRALSQN